MDFVLLLNFYYREIFTQSREKENAKQRYALNFILLDNLVAKDISR